MTTRNRRHAGGRIHLLGNTFHCSSRRDSDAISRELWCATTPTAAAPGRRWAERRVGIDWPPDQRPVVRRWLSRWPAHPRPRRFSRSPGCAPVYVGPSSAGQPDVLRAGQRLVPRVTTVSVHVHDQAAAMKSNVDGVVVTAPRRRYQCRRPITPQYERPTARSTAPPRSQQGRPGRVFRGPTCAHRPRTAQRLNGVGRRLGCVAAVGRKGDKRGLGRQGKMVICHMS
jgi:hypothetical protein